MKTVAALRLIEACLFAGMLLTMDSSLSGEIQSKSRDLIVEGPSDLPEQARTPGNSCFLYSDGGGSTYLYVEQQQGARLSIFDVTDPSKIKLASSISLNVPGAFDFVRPLGARAELVRFRENRGVAILELQKAKKPSMRMIASLFEPGSSEPLGETAFLIVNEPYNPFVRAVPRDYQVIDISAPSDPLLLATVKQVKHKVVNSDTGTTFLLGSEGLTVIRRTSVENDYKVHLMQQASN
jgi:LVIVD repeat